MSSDYWDGWYQQGAAFRVPSQFAVMIATEFAGRVSRIVDFGCGNGRDTVLLDRVAPTLGIDASAAAIAAARAFMPDGTFLCGSVEHIKGEGLLYARFVLHSIPDEVEDALLDQLEGSWTVAFEFRTPDDAGLPKATPHHFRRFVCPDVLAEKLEARGFILVYRVEGRGMAKYGPDDARVARVIAERR
jgi:SAM-dependent methyltransferase